MTGTALLAGAAGLYLLYLVVLTLRQTSMVYPGAAQDRRPPLAPDRVDREVIWLTTGFGRVESWLLPPRLRGGAGPYPAVIVGHGNAELIDTIPGGFLGLRDLGYAVLLVEYPGFGDSQGDPSQVTVTEAFVTAWDTLAARPEIDARHLIGLGRSLGGGAICALSRRRPLAALILVATFTDLPTLAAGYLAPGFLVRDRYDNLAAVRAFGGPVLVVHGTGDRKIPRRHGERLAAAAGGELIRYDTGHDDCPTDFATFWRDVRAFLQAHGLPAGDAQQ